MITFFAVRGSQLVNNDVALVKYEHISLLRLKYITRLIMYDKSLS